MDATLRELKVWFQQLQDAEEKRHTDPTLDAMLNSLVWPRMTWYRSILVRLSEREFLATPDGVKRELLDFVHSIPGTKVVEDLHRHLRRCEDRTSSKQLARSMRWVRAMDSDLLQDIDRPMMKTTPTAKNLAPSKRVGPQLFDPEKGEPSIDKS